MKKFIRLGIMGLIILTFILSGCGSNSEDYDTGLSESKSTEQAELMPEEAISGAVTTDLADGSNQPNNTSINAVLENRKLVYNVQMLIQTTSFEDTMTMIDKAVEELDGYIQNSQISGNDYGYSGNKLGYIVARVPSEKLNKFLSASKSFGNISSQSQSIEDITMRYTDIEARKKSLQVEFDRLLVLVKKAEKLEDIIRLEERLSQIRYELDSLKSQLKGMDNEVSYSTINMDIQEVVLLDSAGDSKLTDRISSAFSKSLYNLGQDIQNFIVGFFGAIPYLFIIGIIIIIAIWISRKFGKNHNFKINTYFQRQDKLENKEKK